MSACIDSELEEGALGGKEDEERHQIVIHGLPMALEISVNRACRGRDRRCLPGDPTLQTAGREWGA